MNAVVDALPNKRTRARREWWVGFAVLPVRKTSPNLADEFTSTSEKSRSLLAIFIICADNAFELHVQLCYI